MTCTGCVARKLKIASTVWPTKKKEIQNELDIGQRSRVLSGIEIEIDRTDSSVNEIRLKDADGNFLRISNRSYNMTVEVPAKPKMVKNYAVNGVIAGVKVDEKFEHKYEADNRKEELIAALRYSEETAVKVEEVEVATEEW